LTLLLVPVAYVTFDALEHTSLSRQLKALAGEMSAAGRVRPAGPEQGRWA
jgi:hypothetical protein